MRKKPSRRNALMSIAKLINSFMYCQKHIFGLNFVFIFIFRLQFFLLTIVLLKSSVFNLFRINRRHCPLAIKINNVAVMPENWVVNICRTAWEKDIKAEKCFMFL